MMYLPRCDANVTKAGISFCTNFLRSFSRYVAPPHRFGRIWKNSAQLQNARADFSCENSVLCIRRCYVSSFRARTRSLQKTRTREKARVKVLNTVRQVQCILKGFHSSARARVTRKRRLIKKYYYIEKKNLTGYNVLLQTINVHLTKRYLEFDNSSLFVIFYILNINKIMNKTLSFNKFLKILTNIY